MSKRVPIFTDLDTATSTVSVTADAGGSGQLLAITRASVAVRIKVRKPAADIEFKVGSGAWQVAMATDGDFSHDLAVDLSTTSIYLRKKSSARRAISITVDVDYISGTQTFPAIAPVSGAGNAPPAIPFLWSESATTASTGGSTPLQNLPAIGTVTVTAGSGVSALTARLEASLDNTTWAGVATVNFSAPGTAQFPIALAYPYLRFNVLSITGGSASANITSYLTQTSVPTGITVATNPSLSGVPAVTPMVVAQSGVPVYAAGSGSVAANGALTLTMGLYRAVPNCWMYFPAGAVFSGSAAGLYYVTMSTTSAGTIYNTMLPAGAIPYIPSAPTTISAAGPGAFTGVTGSITLVSFPLIGGSLGPSGSIKFRANTDGINTANSKVVGVNFGATNLFSLAATSQVDLGINRLFRCAGTQSLLVGRSAGDSSLSTDNGGNGFGVATFSVNTAVTQTLALFVNKATAGEWLGIASWEVIVQPGN